MYQFIKPRAARAMRGWPALLLVGVIPVGLGCANPPPLPTDTGSSTAGPGNGPLRTSVLIPQAAVKAGVVDLGPRRGVSGAGSFYPTLSPKEQTLFTDALDIFKEVDSVSGTVLPDEEGSGLGPTFNGAACAQCHKQPEVGGSSPSPSSPQQPLPNPQIALATLDGARNSIPPFLTADGPIREARFKSDGGVHGLFTIGGRTDAPGCNAVQPDFALHAANGNLSFRIPTAVFGLGLVENIPDAVLEANLASNAAAKQMLGISGVLQRSGNDGTITKFGWKAQNKSLLVFAGEAYNVEQGVANEIFTNERSVNPGCAFNTSPEDHTDNEGLGTGGITDMVADVTSFAIFMRLSAPPTPAAETPTTARGSDLFNQVGCALCHTSTLTAGNSPFSGMSGASLKPYSDFAIHHMGDGLADGIQQGAASGDMFRTAFLWGVGQRIFFLHDGRTGDLGETIEFHQSPGSEANGVVDSFNALSAPDQQAILDFLRSL